MNLNCDCSVEQSHAFYEELPEERQERIRRMKNPALAKKKIFAGRFLQEILQEETGIAISKQQFVYSAAGRPSLLHNDLDFNLSDSGDYVVLAVSDQQVGIDIERRKKNHLSIAKRCFCPEEYEDIVATADSLEQERRFRAYWTMKEAYVKCEGSGLAIPLNSFRIVWEESRTQSVVDKIVHDVINTSVAYGYTTSLAEEYCVSVCRQRRIDEMCLIEKLL